MKLTKNIRAKLGLLKFRRDIHKVRFKRQVVSFDDAVKIGLLYDASDERDYEVVRAHVKHIRTSFKKEVLALGYVDKKVLPPSQFAQLGLDFFTRKDLDFRLIPKDPIVLNFINEKFDILINYNSGKCFPLQYIAAMSQARFRIGRYDQRNMNAYDMMVKITGDPPIKTVIEEVQVFLHQIRSQQS
ncbi:MAG: hypothetical protein U0073_00705 [Bacteroidia bacterium]